ncbi:hypothetical protein Tco_1398771, partial [Tanacetum coccineum]
MEDEEVPLVDGVFEGALGALGDDLEMEALVDAMEVIVNGDAPTIASASAGTEGPIPPKTAEWYG